MAGDLQHPIFLDAQPVPSHDADSEDDATRPSSGPAAAAEEAAPDLSQPANPGGTEEPGSDAESTGSYGRWGVSSACPPHLVDSQLICLMNLAYSLS